jgi:hypothetical protein
MSEIRRCLAPELRRELLTWCGFTAGVVGVSAPSAWASGLGLTASSLAWALNRACQDSRHRAFAAVGAAAAGLGLAIAITAAVWGGS